MLLGIARAGMIGARGLDRAFDRLGARIGEEDRVGKGVLDEPRREGLALRAAIKVRHMDQRRCLFLDRLGQMRMAVPEQIDRDAACEIQITLASIRSEEHTSELQSLMRSSYAVFCLKKKIIKAQNTSNPSTHRL